MTEARGALFGWAWTHPCVVLKQLRHLPLSAKALAGWNFREPGGSRQPWPWLIAEWLAYEACLAGKPEIALVLVLSFDCYVWPADFVKLRRGNFVAPQQVAGAARGWTVILNPVEGRVPPKSNSFDDSLLVGHGG